MSDLFKIIIAVITAFSGLGSHITFAAFEELFTDSLSIVISRSDFLEDMSNESVVAVDESYGYVQDTVLLFFAEDAGFFKKLNALHETGGVTVGSLPEMNLCVIKTPHMSFDELNAYCEKMMEHDAVALATICPAHRIKEQYTPNDPFTEDDWYTEEWNEESPYGNNWWLEAIDARGAWGYDSLYEQIDIGIVDAGFDTEHDELKGKITFPSESEKSRNYPNYHGTHIAGIIAAKSDNGVGISGICQNARLICSDRSPSEDEVIFYDIDVIFGLCNVVKAGAKVVNFSIGKVVESGTDRRSFISNKIDAIIYSYAMGALLSKGYDFIVVQAAGNGNEDGYAVSASQKGLFCGIRDYGAFLPFIGINKQDLLDRIIIVGNASVDWDGYVQELSSNVGDTVDICAPGTWIYSCAVDNGYLDMVGTSMAAPMVTGVASLVWSINPDLTAPEVKKIVCENTKDIVKPSSERFFVDAGYRPYPMVNAKLAVEAALMQKGNVAAVAFSGYSKEAVTFTDDSGTEFVFETNEQGELSCVLPFGNYSVVSQGIDKNLEINENINITVGG